MATAVSTSRPVGGPLTQTRVTTPSNVATNQTRNITAGPSTLFTVLVDNLNVPVGTNTKVWIKLYDDISDGWAPGTTLAYLGFPVVKRTIESDLSMQFLGNYQLMHTSTGLRFENGISVAASKEGGDLATAAPGTTVAVELTHS